MVNIIKTDSIDNINIELKRHILELNIRFAKRNNRSNYISYIKYPETYTNIVEEISNNNYVIYGSLLCNISNITYYQLMKAANCFINKDGYVIKNRYGDED